MTRLQHKEWDTVRVSPFFVRVLIFRKFNLYILDTQDFDHPRRSGWTSTS